MPTLNIFELKQSLRKSVEYLWRYKMFARTVYSLKVGNFKYCRCGKFSPCHCKSRIPPHLKRSIQMPTLNIFELKQSLRKSVEYLWRYRMLARTVYSLKVGNFKYCRCGKFSPCHCKSKIPPHLRLSIQMPTLNIFELNQRWRKYRLKLGISNVVDAQSHHLAIAKVKHLRPWNIPPKCQSPTSSSWSKVFENRLNTFGDIWLLLRQCTGWKWEIWNVVDAQSYHLAIIKLKYLRTWNFPSKCPPSTSSSWSKVFENRLNTFGDMGFFPAHCTGSKWEISNVVNAQSHHLAIAKVK